ncbi:hypothetical protein FA95DRAFT_1563303, partial [Auriscalpium vulgare]
MYFFLGLSPFSRPEKLGSDIPLANSHRPKYAMAFPKKVDRAAWVAKKKAGPQLYRPPKKTSAAIAFRNKSTTTVPTRKFMRAAKMARFRHLRTVVLSCGLSCVGFLMFLCVPFFVSFWFSAYPFLVFSCFCVFLVR